MKRLKKSWKQYEESIVSHFQALHPDCNVRGNQRIIGLSGINRQIDVLITRKVGGYPIEVVIDCKHFSKKINVGIVEAFTGFLADVKASKGVIITNLGYTKGAIARAKSADRDIQLDIIDFEDLYEFSGTSFAFPHQSNDDEYMEIVFSCPFGWQVHEVPMVGYPAGLTKVNVDWEEGWRTKECIYMSFVSKREIPDLESLIALHETTSNREYPGVEFNYFYDLDERFENPFCERMILRTGYYLQYPEIEVTVFMDFGTFCAFFVLSTPDKNKDQNLKKLAFIARTTLPHDLPLKMDVLPIEYIKFFFKGASDGPEGATLEKK